MFVGVGLGGVFGCFGGGYVGLGVVVLCLCLVFGFGVGFSKYWRCCRNGESLFLDETIYPQSLGQLAGHPLNDPRVRVELEDVAKLLRNAQASYDAVLLDVDNGPDAFTRDENAWLYAPAGLRAIQGALRSEGVLAVWSSYRDHGFKARLVRAAFQVEEIPWKARGERGAVHTIWLAQKPRG